MDKYKEIVKEIPLQFCVKCENFEFSTHFEKLYPRCLLRYRLVSAIHQIEANFAFYNPVISMKL